MNPRIFLVLVLLLLCGGCEFESPIWEGQGCFEDRDCLPTEICVEGTCEPDPRAMLDTSTDSPNVDGGEEVDAENLCGDRVCTDHEICCDDGAGGSICRGLDVDGETQRCGGPCGLLCAAGEVCLEGVCLCAVGTADCDGSMGCETETLSNAAHCGACGNACAEGETCENGLCSCGDDTCEVTEACCDNSQGDLRCVDVQGDARTHCGGCGITCGPGELCSEGSCVCDPSTPGRSCGEGRSCCEGVCQSNEGAECACSETCEQGSTCQSGLCLCEDGEPLGSDSNCGACGTACGFGEVCEAGSCVCDTRSCGELGCGESACGFDCGGCSDARTCQNNLCICPTASCAGLGCGLSPCGRPCGECESGQRCVDNQCE